MTTYPPLPSSPARHRKWALAGGVFFMLLMVGGLYYVKWDPYFHKAFVAAAHHSIGASILTGKAVHPPGPSWAAAAGYATRYFNAVWEAMVLGILAGATVQVFVPQNWIVRLLGTTGWLSAVTAGAAAVPSMM